MAGKGSEDDRNKARDKGDAKKLRQLAEAQARLAKLKAAQAKAGQKK